MSRFDHIFQKEMTRKQFLVVLGMSIVSVTGFSGIMGIFTRPDASTLTGGKPGYGIRDYGP